jgi:hypothetical protein
VKALLLLLTGVCVSACHHGPARGITADVTTRTFSFEQDWYSISIWLRSDGVFHAADSGTPEVIVGPNASDRWAGRWSLDASELRLIVLDTWKGSRRVAAPGNPRVIVASLQNGVLSIPLTGRPPFGGGVQLREW